MRFAHGTYGYGPASTPSASNFPTATDADDARNTVAPTGLSSGVPVRYRDT